MELTRPDWAERLRAEINVGRPADEDLKTLQKRVRDLIAKQLANNVPRESVLADVVRRHGRDRDYWWNVFTGKGRPANYFE
jgi:hypothetical protein